MKSVRENVSSVPGARRICNTHDPLVEIEGKSVLLFRVCQHSVPASRFDVKIVTMVLISKRIRLAGKYLSLVLGYAI
jgi:hypothetical protein